MGKLRNLFFQLKHLAKTGKKVSRTASIMLRYPRQTAKIVSALKQIKGTQLEFIEILAITRRFEKYTSCKLLVFGMGNDSIFWHKLNETGQTVFLENHEEWLHKIVSQCPTLEAHLVQYPHNILQWKEIMDLPERLEMELPKDVKNQKWDVVLVDSPMGHEMKKSIPGRMSSIYMAKQLVALNGRIFVHDAERPVEKAYCKKYLKEEHRVSRVWGRALLKEYYYPAG